MSDYGGGRPGWVPYVGMEVTTSTEGAGLAEACADPAQQRNPASALYGASRDQARARFPTCLSARERSVGTGPAEAPALEENMEVFGVLLAPTSNLQENSGAPVTEDIQISVEENFQGVREAPRAQPSPRKEAPDTTMNALPGTEGERDGRASHTEEKGASLLDPVRAQCARGERDMDPGDADAVSVESSPGAAGLDLSWMGLGSELSVPWETYTRVQREKDQLARRLDALQTTVPEATTVKATQLIQLKLRAAQLEFENKCLLKKEKLMREENAKMEAALAAQSTSGEPTRHTCARVPAPSRAAPSAKRSELDWVELTEEMSRLRAERNQLGVRLADLLAVLPAAFAMKVTHIQQLEEHAAQLRCDYDRLAQETEQLRREKEAWAAAVQENAVLRAFLGAEEMNPQGKLGG